MSVTDDRERVWRVLRGRALAARMAARETVAVCKATKSESLDLQNGVSTTRCAWCGRRRPVDDRWVSFDSEVDFDTAETAHGICEECVTALRRPV